MQRLIPPLFEPEQAKNALTYAYRSAKPHLVAGRRLQIEVREEKRQAREPVKRDSRTRDLFEGAAA